MTIDESLRSTVSNVFSNQRIAVLGVSKNDDPYSCLVAFVVTDDLRYVIFATMRARKKYRYMQANPRVTLMIDDREHKPTDYTNTTSIAVVGTAQEVDGTKRSDYAQLLLNKHPTLTDFVESEDSAIMEVKIEDMYVVDNFESLRKISFDK
ncbi:hypothetical protein EU537_03100 [Candidatus Thorarchaeota archaeon]|nr:MAG: hypothetical protein EU537_03100 [Candidatus Thorarchaeota archaeon]